MTQPPDRATLMALLGPSHPHDEARECGTCKAYNLLAEVGETPPGPHPEPENFDDIRRNNELDALWTDPQPETPEGQRLWRYFQIGRYGVRPDAAAIRDFGQRVCQIESEASTPGPNRDPLGIWRGVCGHVWDRRREDTETCPRCVGETPPGPLDVERLARAIGATKGLGSTDIVETTGGAVSALDYPEEWFETPRVLAEAIAREYEPLTPASPSHVHDFRDYGSRGEGSKPDIRCACGASPNEPPGLDAAWARAEAALPEGWSVWWVQNDKHLDAGWNAVAGWDGAKNPADARTAEGEGPTPAAALNALATRLAATPPGEDR